MSRGRGPRSPRTPRGLLDRSALVAASVTVLSLAASGCVVVHGEREVLPAATRAEAAEALRDFTAAYNEADKAYDRSLDADYVTGALGAIDAARLDAGREVNPAGNPSYVPLEFTDTRFTIPKKAGWPRWFVADSDANKGDEARWLLVFTRSNVAEPWAVAYLTLLDPDDVPAFKTDQAGWAEPVTANSAELAVAPKDLSEDYATFLKDGGGDVFAPGVHTSAWVAQRKKSAIKPGLVTQYIDEPLVKDDFAPLGLRTADGGALVFFATHHYEKQTAALGTSIPTPSDSVLALTKGEIKQSLTLEFVSNQAVLDPAKGSASQGVEFLSRIQGLTAAQGE
ncbi:hypothetical protein RB628_29565 [Streptomyces sp. ADMS]|uniref:hypothetical protein n=1 Tax=Streptomyces sp. ADMS TaxID=3071415 RepID=UPI00296F3B27|nr:hypothetical protein [Streptomyces sp. ADMS]MDW4909379.1 hypothetical protein [Streptomyces sp. ADMS]